MLMSIKMTAEELEITKEFLGRTSLKGAEVPAFVAIMERFKKPEVVKIQDKEVKSGE